MKWSAYREVHCKQAANGVVNLRVSSTCIERSNTVILLRLVHMMLLEYNSSICSKNE